MTTDEAIRRLTDIGRRIEPDGNDYIALEMAVRALDEQEKGDKHDE